MKTVWNKIKNIYHKNEEIINYLFVGGCTTLISLLSKWLLWFTLLDPKDALKLQISIIISWVVSVMFAYVANRLFVFKSQNKNFLKEISSFVGARILTLGMEMGTMWFFVTFLKLDTEIWTMIWTIVTQILIVIFNYIFSKLFVFKKK